MKLLVTSKSKKDKDKDKEIERLRDALDHIMRVSDESRSVSRRNRWITQRAKSALADNEDWRDFDTPKKSKFTLRESQQQTMIENLKAEIEFNLRGRV